MLSRPPYGARATILLSALLLLNAVSPPATAKQHPASPASLARRAEIAGRKQHLIYGSPSWPKATASSLALALDANPTDILSTTITGDGESYAALTDLGVIQPIRGGSFAILSSGGTGTIPEPGSDFFPVGEAGDTTTLTITLRTRPGVSRISLNYNFLSAEYPEFVGSQFDDRFEAKVIDATGEHTFGEASVNSSFFFPASASRAGGSNFDIFADDPDGVDDEFGSGFPDAGLTDFQSISTMVHSNGTITLVFSVGDASDGILDSAVLLDNLRVAAIEAIDLSDERFLVNGHVTTDAGTLATGGGTRLGVAADGSSRLLLRDAVSGPGTVHFCLDGGAAPADGGLDVVGGNDRRTCVDGSVAATTQGYFAFAIYRAPDDFNRGGDENLEKRSTRISAQFQPSGGPPPSGDPDRAEIEIVRPPLVFVHGLWSDRTTWSFPLAQDGRFVRYAADYHTTNASHFADNASVVPEAIEEAVRLSRSRGYATTKVDVIGHSMGGILARIWAADPAAAKDLNFREGDIHEIFTLDTPHTGSPLANLLVSVRNAFLIGPIAASAFRAARHPIDEGAIDDLQKSSAPVRQLRGIPVPGHAFIGRGGSDLVADIGHAGEVLGPEGLGVVFQILAFFGDLSDIFPSLQHDLIVGRDSQQGGLPLSACTVVGGGDGLHLGLGIPGAPGNTASSIYSQDLFDLLNRHPGESVFATFPATAGLARARDEGSAAGSASFPGYKLLPAKSVSKGIVITAPHPGTILVPGQTVHVVVAPLAGKTLNRVLITARGVAVRDLQSPFSVDLVVPPDTVGDFTLVALGANKNGDYFTGDPVALTVTPTAQLQSLEIVPSEVVLPRVGKSIQLTVVGHYGDSVDRNLSRPNLGTTYLTTDPDIATVSTIGVVTAVGPGTTTVIAQNGDVQDSITVRVPQDAGEGPCGPDSTSLCLNHSRFRVRVQWRDATGRTGVAQPVPFSSADAGLFWFFDPNNWEMLVKVLNGCGVNGHYWVFSAATTDVNYTLTVTDERSGQSKQYVNPLGRTSPAITDTSALGGCAPADLAAARLSAPEAAAPAPSPAAEIAWPAGAEVAEIAAASCVAGSSNLCLSSGRFRVEVSWKDFQGHTGQGTVVPFSSADSGLFWFFDSANWEMLVKIVNGCGLNQRFWVFGAATTSVQYSLKVTDTVTGASHTYSNPLGQSSPAIIDTSAFAGCN